MTDDLLRRLAQEADVEFDAARVRAAAHAKADAARAAVHRREGFLAGLAAAAAVAAIGVALPHIGIPLGTRPSTPAAPAPASSATAPPMQDSADARTTAKAVLAALRTTKRPYCILVPSKGGAVPLVVQRLGHDHDAIWFDDASCLPALQTGDGRHALTPGALPLDLGAPLRRALATNEPLRLSGEVLTIAWRSGGTTTYRIAPTSRLPRSIDQRVAHDRLRTEITWLAVGDWPNGRGHR